MEITNCEQYVLAELDYEQRRNERLVAENNKLAKQLDAMTKRANGYRQIINRPKTPVEALADGVMREEMLTRFTYAEVTDAGRKLDAELMYLTEPDSWEKLEEDLDKCVAEGTACTYFSKDGTCQSCSLSNITTGCSPKVIEDIVSRIRKLRGEA